MSAPLPSALRARFPYAIPTVLSDGREKRREVFEARAFGASVADGGRQTGRRWKPRWQRSPMRG